MAVENVFVILYMFGGLSRYEVIVAEMMAVVHHSFVLPRASLNLNYTLIYKQRYCSEKVAVVLLDKCSVSISQTMAFIS